MFCTRVHEVMNLLFTGYRVQGAPCFTYIHLHSYICLFVSLIHKSHAYPFIYTYIPSAHISSTTYHLTSPAALHFVLSLFMSDNVYYWTFLVFELQYRVIHIGIYRYFSACLRSLASISPAATPQLLLPFSRLRFWLNCCYCSSYTCYSYLLFLFFLSCCISRSQSPQSFLELFISSPQLTCERKRSLSVCQAKCCSLLLLLLHLLVSDATCFLNGS